MIVPYILIMVIATSTSQHSGAASVVVQFDDKQTCLSVGDTLAKDAHNRNNNVLTWGCFPKGKQ